MAVQLFKNKEILNVFSKKGKGCAGDREAFYVTTKACTT